LNKTDYNTFLRAIFLPTTLLSLHSTVVHLQVMKSAHRRSRSSLEALQPILIIQAHISTPYLYYYTIPYSLDTRNPPRY
jgi:hypothetical protein